MVLLSMFFMLRRVEHNISGEKPGTSLKATYVQVIIGNQIGKTDGTE